VSKVVLGANHFYPNYYKFLPKSRTNINIKIQFVHVIWIINDHIYQAYIQFARKHNLVDFLYILIYCTPKIFLIYHLTIYSVLTNIGSAYTNFAVVSNSLTSIAQKETNNGEASADPLGLLCSYAASPCMYFHCSSMHEPLVKKLAEISIY
jgi:hypothetical protein